MLCACLCLNCTSLTFRFVCFIDGGSVYGVSGTIVYISPVFYRVRFGGNGNEPNTSSNNSDTTGKQTEATKTVPASSFSPAYTLTRAEYSTLLALQQRWEELTLDAICREEIEMSSLEAILDYMGYDADDPITLLLMVSNL